MFATTRLVILTAFWKSVLCAGMTLKVRGDSTSLDYYKEIVINESFTKVILSKIFIVPSASFSIKYHENGAASTITFSESENGTFFKCWHQAINQSVTCELQTLDQCMLALINKSCCLQHRNSFLWNTTSEFLFSPEIKNITFNCGYETHQLKLFVYERLQTSSSSSEPDMIFSSSTKPHVTLSSSTSQHMTITPVHSEDSYSNSTGLIIGIVVAVILVVILAMVGVMVWNRKKKQKSSKNNAAIKESRLESSENTRQNNFPNPYHNSVNVMPGNVKILFPNSSLIKDDFKDKQMVNAKPNYSNISSHQTSEGNYFATDYDIPKSQHSTIEENVDKLEFYSTNNEVQQLIDDYTTIDSCGLQIAGNTSIDRKDDAEVDYSIIADTEEKREYLQSDNITANELNVKNPYSVMGNIEKTITNPYNVLPLEPNTSSCYFVLLSEGELAPYSMAKDESRDHGTAVENEKNTQED